jgi:hypothetical protein
MIEMIEPAEAYTAQVIRFHWLTQEMMKPKTAAVPQRISKQQAR